MTRARCVRSWRLRRHGAARSGGGGNGVVVAFGRRRPGGRSGHQYRRAVNARRYSLVRGSSGPMASRRSTNSCRATSSSRTRSSNSSNLLPCRHHRPETSTPTSRRRAWAANVRLASVSGSAPGERVPRRDRRDRSAGAPGPRWRRRGPARVRGLAQGGLVAGGHQRVRLSRGRRQALHESSDLRLGTAPMNWSTTWPWLMAKTAGMDCTLKACATEGLSSTLTLASSTAPRIGHRFLDHGPEVLQGPHHGARDPRSPAPSHCGPAPRPGMSRL